MSRSVSVAGFEPFGFREEDFAFRLGADGRPDFLTTTPEPRLEFDDLAKLSFIRVILPVDFISIKR